MISALTLRTRVLGRRDKFTIPERSKGCYVSAVKPQVPAVADTQARVLPPCFASRWAVGGREG